MSEIEPFHVMEMLKQTQGLQNQGREVVHLSIGEPDFQAPPAVLAALRQAADNGHTGYTEAKGLLALRQRIADWYATQWDVDVDSEQILITQGASGALTLACLALINPGDEVLMPDPSYACNRHFVAAAGGRAHLLGCGPEQAFQFRAGQLEAAWRDTTRGIMVASPANPTGTCIQADVLGQLAGICQRKGGFLICDEIYQGLVYGRPAETLLSQPITRGDWDGWLVINSFSKYFGMTGWRLGWLVAPKSLCGPLERLAQNLTICAPTLAQHAAMACFDEDTLALCEERRQAFEQRRDRVLERLGRMGLQVPCKPDGAFYVYLDVSGLCTSSMQWCKDLLETTGLCLAPGIDFSVSDGHRYVRLSYARDIETLDRGMDLLEGFIQRT
jgi:aspartate/methionine/tyrosine aminotransferase